MNREHLARIKALPCGVCGEPGPSEAHHPRSFGAGVSQRADDLLAIPLCSSCHRDQHNGIHGRRAMWDVLKLDEATVLANTVRKLLYGGGL